MLTHEWVDQYSDCAWGQILAQAIMSSEQFDLGDICANPFAEASNIVNAKPPSENCILQFSTSKAARHSHILILWRSQSDGSALLMLGNKIRGINEWRTTLPCTIKRIDENFEFEIRGREESTEALVFAHASTLKAFRFLESANVTTIDHAPPTGINLVRRLLGKFPILAHKAVVVAADVPQ